MADTPSVWKRLRNLFSPPRESYDTRKARPGDAAERPGGQYAEGDQRRGMDPPSS